MAKIQSKEGKFLIVRSKIDDAVRNNERDFGMDRAATLSQVHAEFRKYKIDKV